MNVIEWWMLWLTVNLCYLKRVQTNVCDYIVETGDLYCRDVSIGVLRSGDYPFNVTNVTNIRRLNLASTILTSIEYNALDELSGLVYLELNENKIKELDNRIFKNTPDLRQLFLARNQINTLSRTLFNSIPELTHLDISGNPLSSLEDPQIFSSLRNLLYLTIDNIRLNRIPTNLIDPLISLRTVSLNDNDIKCLCNLQNITIWAKNKCISMNMNCQGKGGLKYTSLQSYFDKRCGPNRKATRKIPIFNSNYSPNPSPWYDRQYFDRRNPWDNHHPSRRRYPYPDYVEEEYIYDDTDTNETSVTNVTTFCQKKQCRFSNKLDRMDCEANGLTNFRSNNYPFKERGFTELILDNNNLEKLEADAFDGVSELRFLSLRKNGLSTLHPDVFKKLTNLIFLDLSDNILGGLFEENLFSSQNNLKILYINNNGISVIDRQLFKPLKSIKRLFMSGNPLDCNCELRPSVLILLKRKVLTKGTCRYPVLYDGNSWDILKSSTYCRLPLDSMNYGGKTNSTTLTIMFFAIILLICGLIQLTHYMVNKFHKPKPGDTYDIPPDFDLF